MIFPAAGSRFDFLRPPRSRHFLPTRCADAYQCFDRIAGLIAIRTESTVAAECPHQPDHGFASKDTVASSEGKHSENFRPSRAWFDTFTMAAFYGSRSTFISPSLPECKRWNHTAPSAKGATALINGSTWIIPRAIRSRHAG